MTSQNGSALSPAVQEAAERLIRQHGADGFSMEQLARESNLSRASLYRQVSGREELLAALEARGVSLGERLDIQDRILAASRTVFARAGFDGATLEEIAAEAEVGLATVYRQFKDKQGLISAFGARFGPRRAVREAATKPSGDLRVDLERVAASVLRAAQADLDLMKLALLERLRGGEWAELFKSSPMSAQKTMGKLFKFYVERGVIAEQDTARTARAFTGMILSFILSSLVEGAPFPDPEDTARYVTRIFLDGLAPANRSGK